LQQLGQELDAPVEIVDATSIEQVETACSVLRSPTGPWTALSTALVPSCSSPRT
jgi:hypothetical protein